MKSTVEILREARALIDTPEKWAKGSGHHDDRFCTVEAIGAVTRETPAFGDALRAVGNAAGVTGLLFVWNDSSMTTHADVLAAFDRAIAAEEQS